MLRVGRLSRSHSFLSFVCGGSTDSKSKSVALTKNRFIMFMVTSVTVLIVTVVVLENFTPVVVKEVMCSESRDIVHVTSISCALRKVLSGGISPAI